MHVCILLVISYMHCSTVPEIKVQLILNPVCLFFNMIEDKCESNDKATFGVVKEANTHKAWVRKPQT